MSILELAERTGISVNSIKRAEKDNGEAQVSRSIARLLIDTLTAAGVTFLAGEGGAGSGARLTTPDVQPLSRKRPSKTSDD